MTQLVLTGIAGNPAALVQRADQFLIASESVREIFTDAAGITVSGTSLALTSHRAELSRSLEQGLELAGRIEQAGAALHDYAATLLRAQEREEQSTQRLEDLELVHDAHSLVALQAADEARGELQRARNEVDEAAKWAIHQLHAVFGSEDTRQLGALSAAVFALTDGVSQIWTDRVFREVWASTKQIFMTVTASLTVSGILITLCAAGVATDPLVGALMFAGVSVLTATVMQRILSDVTRRSPRVTLAARPTDARRPPRNIGEALKEAREVDGFSEQRLIVLPGGTTLASDTHTAVKVTKVVDPTGQVRWRVALPSTQDWVTPLPGGDSGATNDLDSNLALMLTPIFHTQYQRGVLDAMRQAGVGPDDPVMLVGFSQGGILAAHLAAYNTDYNWRAVVAAGAPIDSTPVPRNVSVVSVQHSGDPVHVLDTLTTGRGTPVNRANWHTISGDADGPAHSAHSYSTTLLRHRRDVSSNFPELDEFFVAPNAAFGSRSDFYTWQEREH